MPLIDWNAYSPRQQACINEVLGLRLRAVVMQLGASPTEANSFLAESVACALRIVDAEYSGDYRGPVPRSHLRAVTA